MSQTTLYGLIAGLALVLAGALLLWKGETVTGGALVAAGLGALGLGKQAADSPKSGGPGPGVAVILTAGLLLAAPVRAQDAVPLTDVTHRAHVTVNGGTMILTTGQQWSGASLGGAVGYNLHPKLSIFGGYDHGFPVNDVDSHLNLFRAVGSLRVHPNGFVGFGYAWFDKHTDGALAQLLLTKQIMPRVQLSGVYAHIFSRGDLDDFEYVRVFVNYHLLGKGD